MFNQALLIQKNLLRLKLNRFSCQRLLSGRYFRSARTAEAFSDRAFSSTSYQMGTKKHRPPKKNLQSSSVTAEPTALRPPTNKATYKTFAETLSLRRSPTLLYQAQSRTRFVVGCYLLSGFCIAWAITNFRNEVLFPFQRLPVLITIITSGVSVFMLACGCWLIARPRRIIHSINALPSSLRSDSRSLLLRIETAAVLPGKQPSSFVVDSGDVTLASPVALNIEEKSKAESAEIHRRQTEINKRNKTRILTAPFRQASHLIWRAFLVLKSLLTPDGFIRMRVRGRNGTWKISQSAAWALDNGKVLDRLVKRGR